jgi:hypothetical protein
MWVVVFTYPEHQQVIEFLASRDGKAGIRVRRDSTVDPVQAEFYTTLNTTKASDGTLKAASR